MILARAGLRHYLHHPLQAFLLTLGIALGVAVVVATELTRVSAQRAFDIAAETIAGRTTHQIVGGPRGLDERVYAHLRLSGWRDGAPVVEGHARVPSRPGLTLQILGIDPFADTQVRRFANDDARGDLLTQPGAALVSPALAAELGVREGAQLQIEVQGGPRTLIVAGLLAPRDDVAAEALASVVVADIATAQEWLHMAGRLSRIDLVLSPGEAGERALAQLRKFLSPGARIAQPGQTRAAVAKLADAFYTNLRALSLLAVVVGVFLIYNAMNFAVVSRRPLYGRLRAIGVGRAQLASLILIEALAFGIAGTVAGLALGILLAQGLLDLVTRTINDLYFVLDVTRVSLSPAALGSGIALGLGATLIAAAKPAFDAAHAPPLAVMSRIGEESAARRVGARSAWIGIGAMLAGVALLAWTHGVAGAYAGLFLVIAGYASCVPAMMAGALYLAARLRLGWTVRLALRGVAAARSRTGMAVAALAVAVASTVSVALMIHGFRDTLATWLDNYLQADVYVVATGGGDVPLAPEVIERLLHAPGVAQASLGRRVELASPQGGVETLVLHPAPRSRLGFRFKEGEADDAWETFASARGVLVSEPYAYHNALHVGERVTLHTEDGPVEFPIAGVYYDFSSDRGVVLMHRDLYLKHWQDKTITSMGLFAAEGMDKAHWISALRGRAGAEQALLLRSNAQLKHASLAIFERTFAVTEVLRLLAVIVAFAGVMSAALAVQLERAREHALLRALGVTPAQTTALQLGETAVMGAAAGLFALPLGIAMAWVLVHVINLRAFGWTLAFEISPAILLQGFALALVAALIAGIYPAWRARRVPPAAALRGE